MNNTKSRTIKNSTICYFLIVILFSIFRILSSFGLFDFLGSWGKYFLNGFIQIGFLFSISVFVFSVLQKTKTKDTLIFYGYKKISKKAILYSFLIGIIVYVLNIFVASFFNLILQSLGYTFSSSSSMTSYPFWLLILNLIMTAVLPGICEETVHRGMLLKSFASLGAKKAIILSGLLFGLLHLNIEQFFYATLIGFLLGYITLLSENIIPAIIIHFMNNALNVFMSYSNFHGLGFGNIFGWIDYNLMHNPVIGFLFVFALIVLLVMALLSLLKKLFKETALKNITQLQQAVFNQIIRDTYLQEINRLKNGDFTNKIPQMMEFNEFDKMYQQTSLNIGNSGKIDNEIMQEESPLKINTYIKIILIFTFVLTIALTLYTFVAGLLI